MNTNILVDPLPTEYNGYLIHTEYYYGILISQCLEDTEFFADNDDGQLQKLAEALSLLYGKGIPPFEEAMEGLRWFLTGGKSKNQGSQSDEQIFSFWCDDSLIFSAFRKNFGVDLQSSHMHWFEFLALLADLGDTAFSNVCEIRQMKPDEYKHYSAAAKAKIRKLKERYRIRKDITTRAYTPEEQAKIDEFNRRMGMG